MDTLPMGADAENIVDLFGEPVLQNDLVGTLVDAPLVNYSHHINSNHAEHIVNAQADMKVVPDASAHAKHLPSSPKKSSYQVLARKYRPKNFSELLGQEHVSTALSNALNQDRLHHAYLFTGTRGVGKTTIARILAKCLNCEIGVSATPCGVCSACTAVDEGRFLDLIEIDAASRTKVEDTRELLDNVPYAPVQGRYKVYLIDEVHMLSASSFNALLKTLEEPPPHVKFILATTDPQKVPITVLSRCLQFVLRPLPAPIIASHLVHIFQQESVQYEESAISALAQAANGSVRDALSLSDQAIAFGNGVVRTKDVASMLGLIEDGDTYALIEDIYCANHQKVGAHIEVLRTKMVDAQAFNEAILKALHHIATAQILPNLPQDLAPNQQQMVAQLAAQMLPESIQLFYDIALKTQEAIKYASTPIQALEMGLLRMLTFNFVSDSQAIVYDDVNDGQHTITQNTNNPDANTQNIHDNSQNIVDSTQQASKLDDAKLALQAIDGDDINSAFDDDADGAGNAHNNADNNNLNTAISNHKNHSIYNDEHSNNSTNDLNSSHINNNTSINHALINNITSHQNSDNHVSNSTGVNIGVNVDVAGNDIQKTAVNNADVENSMDVPYGDIKNIDNAADDSNKHSQDKDKAPNQDALFLMLCPKKVDLVGAWDVHKWDYWLHTMYKSGDISASVYALASYGMIEGDIKGSATLFVEHMNKQTLLGFDALKDKVAVLGTTLRLDSKQDLITPSMQQKQRNALVYEKAMARLGDSAVVRMLCDNSLIVGDVLQNFKPTFDARTLGVDFSA